MVKHQASIVKVNASGLDLFIVMATPVTITTIIMYITQHNLLQLQVGHHLF